MKMREAVETYVARDREGGGYAPYAGVAGDDTVEAAVAAAVEDGWTVALHPANTSEITVLRDGDGTLVGLGDRCGAWAVVLSDRAWPQV